VLVPPSPKFQLQEVGEFVDKSVKVTLRVLSPEVGEPEKLATGATHGSLAVVKLQIAES